MDSFAQFLPHGAKIERYQIERVLGIGGFGITYLATDTQLGHQVAIKEFLPDDCAAREHGGSRILAKTNRQQDYQYGLQRFLEEARTLAKFKHPNIVRVNNFIEANNTGYMVMEYEPGEALDDYLKRINFNGKMPEAEILSIILPLLRGLAEVHQQGLLHRDIKPGNIYRRQNGEPMLIDFGAARYALGAQSKSISAIISMGYAPPEQYSSSGRQNQSTDLYALAATVYELLTGKPPIESTERNLAIQEDESDPLRSLQSLAQQNYSLPFLQTMDACLQLKIKQRPQSAEAVIQGLTGEVVEATVENTGATRQGGTRKLSEQEGFSASKKTPTKKGPGSLFKVILPVLGVAVIGLGAWYLGSQSKLQPQGAGSIGQSRLQDSSAKPARADKKAEKVAVYVQVVPRNAKISFKNNGQVFKQGMLLDPGGYELWVSHPGYNGRSTTIQVAAGMKPKMVFLLPKSNKKPVSVKDILAKEELPKKNLAIAEGYLRTNLRRSGMAELEPGLQYKVVKPGYGVRPGKNQTVRVHYKVELINGALIDSSYQRGKASDFAVASVIKGMSKALQQMPVGSHWRLYIHPSLAYGKQGGMKIPPNSLLIMDVELQKIVK